MNERSLNRLVSEDRAKSCPECGCKEILVEDKEIVCRACGLVLE